MATTSALLPFSCSGTAYLNDTVFDPELVYAQVIAEARMHAQMTNLEQSAGRGCRDQERLNHRSRSTRVSRHDYCFSAHFKPLELQRSLEDLEGRRSWKSSLLFWRRYKNKHKRNYSGCATPVTCPPSKSRSRVAKSAPILDRDDDDDENGCSMSPNTLRWNKPIVSLGSLAGALSPTPKGEGPPEFPYIGINHHTRPSRFLPTRPIYFVS